MPSSRSSKPQSRSTLLSKKLSWLLRHGATAENLPLGPGGYANLSDVLLNRQIRSLKPTLSEIRDLVRENDKQRFSLIPKPDLPEGEDGLGGGDDPRNYLIRANQGHSLALVGNEGLLKEIVFEEGEGGEGEGEWMKAVHGTTHAAWMLIVGSGGLKRMGRNHVHFAKGLPEGFKEVGEDESGDGGGDGGGGKKGEPVISGMRNSSKILIYVDVAAAIKGGIKFWLSDNRVILSEGNAEGLIPIEYFKKVEDRTGEGILVLDGKIVKEAPAKWAGRKR